MLTFARKVGQGVRIGDQIRITVKEIRGRQVRLVIEAPREVRIYREEIWDQIASENKLAAQVEPDRLNDLE